MKEQDINIQMAWLDGIDVDLRLNVCMCGDTREQHKYITHHTFHPIMDDDEPIPNYVLSYHDTMRVIQQVCSESNTLKQYFLLHLAQETTGKTDPYDVVSDMFKFITATPLRLCVALLKTVGKYKN